jgi:Lamin Tail Domain
LRKPRLEVFMDRPIRIRLSALTLLAVVALLTACSNTPGTSSQSSGTGNSAALPTSVSAAATASASTPVQISNANINANDATVTLRNTGSQPVNLGGWTLMVGTTPVALPSSATISPGQSLTLHSASGSDSSSDVYLGGTLPNVAGAVQPGTRITLQNSTGSPVTAFTVPNG